MHKSKKFGSQQTEKRKEGTESLRILYENTYIVSKFIRMGNQAVIPFLQIVEPVEGKTIIVALWDRLRQLVGCPHLLELRPLVLLILEIHHGHLKAKNN